MKRFIIVYNCNLPFYVCKTNLAKQGLCIAYAKISATVFKSIKTARNYINDILRFCAYKNFDSNLFIIQSL